MKTAKAALVRRCTRMFSAFGISKGGYNSRLFVKGGGQ